MSRRCRRWAVWEGREGGKRERVASPASGTCVGWPRQRPRTLPPTTRHRHSHSHSPRAAAQRARWPPARAACWGRAQPWGRGRRRGGAWWWVGVGVRAFECVGFAVCAEGLGRGKLERVCRGRRPAGAAQRECASAVSLQTHSFFFVFPHSRLARGGPPTNRCVRPHASACSHSHVDFQSPGLAPAPPAPARRPQVVNHGPPPPSTRPVHRPSSPPSLCGSAHTTQCERACGLWSREPSRERNAPSAPPDGSTLNSLPTPPSPHRHLPTTHHTPPCPNPSATASSP